MYRQKLSGRDLEDHLDDCIMVVDKEINPVPMRRDILLGKMMASFARTFEQEDNILEDLI